MGHTLTHPELQAESDVDMLPSYNPEVSPITYQQVPKRSLSHQYAVTYQHSLKDGFADLTMTAPVWHRLVGACYYDPVGPMFTYDETRVAFFLIRSYLWRVHRGLRIPFLVCTEDELLRREALIQDHRDMDGH